MNKTTKYIPYDLFLSFLVLFLWSIWDLWIHDYAIMPYWSKTEYIWSSSKNYLWGFWTFAALNFTIICALAKKWKLWLYTLILGIGGWQTLTYHILLPTLNPNHPHVKADYFLPPTLNWLKDNLFLKILSKGSDITIQGLILGLIIKNKKTLS